MDIDSLEMHMRRKRMSLVLRLVLCMAIAALGFVAMPTSTASAASSCYGSSCEGVNPEGTTCANDAVTILSEDAVTLVGGSWGNLELRYSPSCYSNWVRFTPWHGIQAFFDAHTGGYVNGSPWIWRAGIANSLRGVIGSSEALDSTGLTNWTAMVTAAGITCMSVGITSTDPSTSGQGDRSSQGTYNAPCSS